MDGARIAAVKLPRPVWPHVPSKTATPVRDGAIGDKQYIGNDCTLVKTISDGATLLPSKTSCPPLVVTGELPLAPVTHFVHEAKLRPGRGKSASDQASIDP